MLLVDAHVIANREMQHCKRSAVINAVHSCCYGEYTDQFKLVHLVSWLHCHFFNDSYTYICGEFGVSLALIFQMRLQIHVHRDYSGLRITMHQKSSSDTRLTRLTFPVCNRNHYVLALLLFLFISLQDFSYSQRLQKDHVFF